LEEGYPWKVRTSFLTQHYLNGDGDGGSILVHVMIVRRAGGEPRVKVERDAIEETNVVSRKDSRLTLSQRNG